ncbi:MAG: hypothetical protein JNJ76_10610 [Candidatus Competibacter sp.]|nr:hypothetical protein [Candidatus Competibacter sp.]
MRPAARPFGTEQAASLPPAVAETGKIHFEGNIVPHQWYQHVTLASGKPDLPAITILSEIIYWYRPYQTLTKGGKPVLRKHFDGDRFQCTAAYFADKFGLTKDQTRKALKRLEDAGYIHREYRDIVQQGILRNCITFVEPVPSAILAITQPESLAESGSGNDVPPSPAGDPPSPVGDPPSPVGAVYKGIEITTEISTKTTTTTPNPSSSTERAAATGPARGGRGAEDQNPQPQDRDQELTTLETTAQNPVSQEEARTAAAMEESSETADEHQKTAASEKALEGQRPELAFPAKLTEQEQEDIAAQIHTLPPKTAQQMLDVVAAKIAAGQIRTNPAAVLRGIVRKHRADPSSFDPSVGFQVAAARRRREEAEERFQRALAARDPAPAPLPLPSRQNGQKVRPEGLKMLLQVCHQTLHMPLPPDCLNPT